MPWSAGSATGERIIRPPSSAASAGTRNRPRAPPDGRRSGHPLFDRRGLSGAGPGAAGQGSEPQAAGRLGARLRGPRGPATGRVSAPGQDAAGGAVRWQRHAAGEPAPPKTFTEALEQADWNWSRCKPPAAEIAAAQAKGDQAAVEQARTHAEQAAAARAMDLLQLALSCETTDTPARRCELGPLLPVLL